MPVEYKLVTAQDIPRAYEIETAGYPPDEAASLSSLETRQRDASLFFLGAYSPSSTLVGFICATLTPSPTLTHDSMSTHVPSAPYVAIHSVCVSPDHRRQGIAWGLLEEYLERLRGMGKEGVRGARLIAHEELVGLYEKAGFRMVGESEVQHGARPWFELAVDFPPSSSSTSQSPSTSSSAPAIVDEVRSPGAPFSRFASSSSSFQSTLVDPRTGLNAADLYCPRPECRCLLLRKGTGKFVRGVKGEFELPALPRAISSPSPAPTLSHGFWSVPSPLSFENIGFSRSTSFPSHSSSPSNSTTVAGQIKYLTCADCDHGPLGWHDTEGRDLGMEVQAENEAREKAGEGKGDGEKGGEVRKGREFLLAVERVRYKV
ncbi:hypothetical protein JCM8547_003803 [Rhodosporidiobolus lusitaniae]